MERRRCVDILWDIENVVVAQSDISGFVEALEGAASVRKAVA
jgi:hypothetical protein